MLLNLEAVTSDNNLRGLRWLHDDVEAHVQDLKAQGIESESYGAMLAPLLLNKLPPNIRLIVSHKIAGSVTKVDQILEHVEVELTARKCAAHNMTPPPHQHDKGKPTATTLLAGGSCSNNPACSYCQQSHSSRDCTTVIDIAAQKQILRSSSGRCFNCLARGYHSRDYRSLGRCFKCKGKHHTSICEGQGQDRTPSSTSALHKRQHSTQILLHSSRLPPISVPVR